MADPSSLIGYIRDLLDPPFLVTGKVPHWDNDRTFGS